MATTEVPLRFARAASAGRVHHGQMVGRRIDQEVRDARCRRWYVRNPNDHEPARPHGAHQIRKGRGWFFQVLQNLEGAGDVVLAGMCNQVIGQRLVADVVDAAPFREIGIEPKIARLRYRVAEGGRPASPCQAHGRPH